MISAAVLALAFALAGTASQPVSPLGLPGIAGLLVAYLRRKEDTGGFLFLYYWQVYTGVFGAAVVIAMSLQNFVPESYQSPRDYHLYLGTVLPSIVIVAAQAVIGTMLLAVRTPDMLKALRVIVVVQLLLGMSAVAISSGNGSEQAAAFQGTLLFPAIWAIYFFVSLRVRHVFETDDWYENVERYYPSETKIFS